MQKFRIRELYQELGDPDKAILKHEYAKQFKVKPDSFRYAVGTKKQSFTADELLFFAVKFDCKVEDLYEVKPDMGRRLSDIKKEKKEKKNAQLQATAAEFGLQK